MYVTYPQQQTPLIPGSLLKAKSLGLRPDHFGILAEVQVSGSPMVLHSREEGVVLTSLDEFSLGRMIEVVNTPGTLEQQRAILRRAYFQIGHPYHVLFANCDTSQRGHSPECRKARNSKSTLLAFAYSHWECGA